MKHCIICWQHCKQGAKYCLSCSSILRDNRTKAVNISKKTWYKYCPICFNRIQENQSFCNECSRTLQHNKQVLNPTNQMSEKKDYLHLDYTYIIKDPKFFRKNKKDFVTYKVIELELRTWYKFTQNLEILYNEWLPKRNRFQGKEKYFNEYLIPIIRKQYERWRLNAIWFWIDVAVESILSSKPINDAKEESA